MAATGEIVPSTKSRTSRSKRGKRAQGEGTVYQRADGRWCAALSPPGGGRKYLYGSTQGEVLEKLTRARHDLSRGILLKDGRVSVAAFLERWLNEVVKQKVRPRTLESYRYLVDQHIKPTLGTLRLERLGPQHIQKLVNDKLAAGLSARTVQFIFAVLRASLRQAERWDLVSRNVARLVDPPKVQRKPVEPLSPDETKALLASVRGTRLEPFVTVLAFVGLRLGETLALKWSAVDLEAGTLRVESTLRWMRGEKWALGEPKSQTSRRTLEIAAPVVETLKAHRVRQLEQRLRAGTAWTDHGFVFGTATGGPLHERNVRRDFNAAVSKAKLPHATPHTLRHGVASLALLSGASPRTVMEQLGHSQISLTMDTYAHVMPVLKRESAAKVAALLAP